MFRQVIHSKIHMAAVTAALPDYSGSITIDSELLNACGMRRNDAVTVANCRTGARFETYIFRAPAGSRRVEVNGAAARLVEVGDRLIVLHFGWVGDDEYRAHRPRVVLCDERNAIERILTYEPDCPEAR